jgi:hypothetical protein
MKKECDFLKFRSPIIWHAPKNKKIDRQEIPEIQKNREEIPSQLPFIRRIYDSSLQR